MFTIEYTLGVERHSERRTRLLQHAHSTNQIEVFILRIQTDTHQYSIPVCNTKDEGLNPGLIMMNPMRQLRHLTLR